MFFVDRALIAILLAILAALILIPLSRADAAVNRKDATTRT